MKNIYSIIITSPLKLKVETWIWKEKLFVLLDFPFFLFFCLSRPNNAARIGIWAWARPSDVSIKIVMILYDGNQNLDVSSDRVKSGVTHNQIRVWAWFGKVNKDDGREAWSTWVEKEVRLTWASYQIDKLNSACACRAWIEPTQSGCQIQVRT